MMFPFPQFGFQIIDGFFCFLGLWVFLFSGFMGSVQLCLGFWVWNWSLKVLGIASFVLILLITNSLRFCANFGFCANIISL